MSEGIPTNCPFLPGQHNGRSVSDPTPNVLDLVKASDRRSDDLREAEAKRIDGIADMRAFYELELRKAESARLDAIRAVDVASAAADRVEATQRATTLATQVTVSAAALSDRVEAARQATAAGQSVALAPIITAIDELRRAMFEQQGQKSAGADQRVSNSDIRLFVVGAIATILPLCTLVIGITTHGKF